MALDECPRSTNREDTKGFLPSGQRISSARATFEINGNNIIKPREKKNLSTGERIYQTDRHGIRLTQRGSDTHRRSPRLPTEDTQHGWEHLQRKASKNRGQAFGERCAIRDLTKIRPVRKNQNSVGLPYAYFMAYYCFSLNYTIFSLLRHSEGLIPALNRKHLRKCLVLI